MTGCQCEWHVHEIMMILRCASRIRTVELPLDHHMLVQQSLELKLGFSTVRGVASQCNVSVSHANAISDWVHHAMKYASRLKLEGAYFAKHVLHRRPTTDVTGALLQHLECEVPCTAAFVDGFRRSALLHAPHLEIINLHGTTCDPVQLRALFSLLCTCSRLKWLAIRYPGFDDDCLHELTLHRFPLLKTLHIKYGTLVSAEKTSGALRRIPTCMPNLGALSLEEVRNEDPYIIAVVIEAVLGIQGIKKLGLKRHILYDEPPIDDATREIVQRLPARVCELLVTPDDSRTAVEEAIFLRFEPMASVVATPQAYVYRAMLLCWVRAQRREVHRPLALLPKELLLVVAGATTLPGRPSPLDHWTPDERTAFVRTGPVVACQDAAPEHAAKRVRVRALAPAS